METSKHTEMIIDFICDTRYEDIPPQAVERAKGRILDCIGAMIKGGPEDVGTVVKDFIRDYGGKEAITVVNLGMKTDLLTATFANGCLSHAIDYDDHYILSHPTIGVVPALLTVAELVGASGKEIITAYVGGLEVYTKVQKCASAEPWHRGFHASGVWGPLSSCAVAGKLLKLDKEQMLMAWGTACSSFCGLKRNMGTMTKPYHCGRAAEGGVLAALLAQRGLTSHPDSFEGKFGFLHVFSSKPNFEYIEQLGKNWDLIESPTLIKPHPSCGGTHAAMNGMLRLIREHDIREENVDHVDVGTDRGGINSLFYNDPQNIYEAKFSMPFVIALLLHYRRWGADLHTEEVVHDPAMRSLYPKVNLLLDDELEGKIDPDMSNYHAIVRVYMKSGEVYRIHAHPPVLDYDEIRVKFDGNTEGLMPKERSDKIAEMLKNIEDYDSKDLAEVLG